MGSTSRKIYAYEEAVSPMSARPTITASRLERLVLGFWLGVAILLFAGGAIHERNRPIDEGGGTWFGLAARSFARDGIVALHGMSILNNPPLGAEPDWYLHWPPLFAISLGLAFKLFGESAATSHALMFAGIAVTAAALYAIVRRCRGPASAGWAVFALLVLPPFFKFGAYVVTQTLALPFIVLALWGFVAASKTQSIRASWAWLGAVFLILAVLMSWEGLLLPFGLVAYCLFFHDRERLRLAIMYLVTAVATFLAIIAFYVWAARPLATELIHIALFRMGFKYGIVAPLRIHSLADNLIYGPPIKPSLAQFLSQYANDVYMLGPLAVVALAGALTWICLQRKAVQGRPLGLIVLGLLSPWVLWAIFMRNHAYIHPQEVLLATPGTAAALGIALSRMLEWSRTLDANVRKLAMMILLGIVPAVLVMGMSREILTLPPFSDAPMFYQHLGFEIGQNTPPGAVVLIANDSRNPAYYSQRHVIRGVINDTVLDNIRSRCAATFPGAPIYLALRAPEVERFPNAVAHEKPVAQTSDFILLRVN